MNYRKLGNTEIFVSELALGSWLTYGETTTTLQAKACLSAALDVGINFIDTANMYAGGDAERFIGESLRGRPRDSYVLATKLYFDMPDGGSGLSRSQIIKQLDDSLTRLETDYVDLYQCHRFDFDTPLEETMGALTEVVAAGKVRHIGFSEWPAEQIAQAVALTGFEKFVSSQPQYSLLWRQPEIEIMPLCAANDITQIVWSPLAQGLLTGKYKAGSPPPADSRAANEEIGGYMGHWMQPAMLDIVDALRPVVAQAQCTMAQFALAWILSNPNVTSAIVGATKPEQLIDSAVASGLKIDPDLFRQAEKITASVAQHG
jgi:1-deoxyxylulose-5-phosphate synthase